MNKIIVIYFIGLFMGLILYVVLETIYDKIEKMYLKKKYTKKLTLKEYLYENYAVTYKDSDLIDFFDSDTKYSYDELLEITKIIDLINREN